VPRRIKAKLARQKPEVVIQYLADLEKQQHAPYDLGRDPKLRVQWWELGGSIAERSPLASVPTSPDEFPDFVGAVIESFKHSVEHQNAWELLWNRSISRPERAVQALFRSCAIHYCRANDLCLTGESNAGRGPVDFAFSQGWAARAIIEMKLMRNSAFWDGILAQTTEYAISEEVKVAYFVAIAYTAEELTLARLEKIRRAAKLATDQSGVEVRPIIIDASRKESASDLQAPKELRDELHGRSSPSDADDLDDESTAA